MATLQNVTDEIAALETLNKDLANWQDKLKKATKKEVADKIKAKIANIRKQIREGKTTDKEVSAKQLADSLLRSRKKFLEMSKKDFNGVIRQLAKRPEYAFLKGYTRQEIIDDIQRKAKPVGWRFKGRGNYKTPTPQQVRRGRANGTVYYENRPNRSDVSQTKQLEKGGSTYARGGEMMSINPKNFTLNEIEDLVPDIRITSITKGTQFDKVGTRENIYPKSQSSIAKWRNTNLTISDYGIIDVSKGSENLYSDMIVYLADDRNDEQAYTIQLFSKDNVKGMKNLISTFIQKMAKGGGVDANYSGEYFSIRDFVNSNKGMDEIISKLYKLNIEDVDDNLDGELGYDTEVIRNVLKGKGYRVTYNDDTEYIIVKKMLPKFSKGGGVDANYSGEYFSIRDFVNSNKGMDEIISKLYKLNIEDVDDNLDGELGYDTEVIRNVLKGKGYRVTYNDDTEYIIVKKMLPKFSKGGSTYAEGGNLEPMDEDDLPVIRYYFEDEAYEYEDGGEIDINDLNIPVHYTMFEDELFEYAQGGNLPRRTISNVTYKVIKDGNGYNVGVFHTGGSAWKVGKPTSKSEAVKLLNMLVKDKSKRTRN